MHRCACASLLLMAACASSSPADCNADPDPAAASLAGAGSIDCGRVPIGSDATAVDACAADALTAKQAFRAHYDLQGTDSRVMTVIAGTSSGQVQSFLYDSDPSGGGGLHATLSRSECIGPRVDTTSGHKKISCTSSGGSVRLCQ